MATTSSIPVDDPFAELGVAPTAGHDEVRRAFRRLARETHPDHRPDDPHAAQRFARLRAAYEEAQARLKWGGRGDRGERGERARAHTAHASRGEGAQGKRGKGMTEHELVAHVQGLRDQLSLRRVFARHGHRPMIATVLARNPAFPSDALAALRRSTDYHWMVEAAIAGRADVPDDLLLDIARQARETVIGMAMVGNERSTQETLDALVAGPIRLDTGLENALATHPELSTGAATRLAGRHATNQVAVTRLIERSDLPAELLTRLASQSARPLIAAAARRDLQRRGLPTPPLRNSQRPPKTLTGLWR